MQYVWFDGKFVEFSKAKVHILTHSLQYGSGLFEGIRGYEAGGKTAIFRLSDHLERFVNSIKIYKMPVNYGKEEFENAILELVKKNKLKDCYIRPFAFYNDINIGLSVKGKKASAAIAAVPFKKYFEGKNEGIKCKVSSWHRINSLILPPEAKASGNYVNSIIASIEAQDAGSDEAIMLSIDGYVAEGPGENIFLVEDGRLVTPSKSADILMGITRDSIIQIAGSMGIEVEKREVHREELYYCDEVFFCGTAAEITPIIEIDGRKVGKGKVGNLTRILQEKYENIVRGRDKEFEHWLTYV
ncbi:MAG: branched-chain amino acid transaminase [Candidatus Micrarchaeaceae archaeon]